MNFEDYLKQTGEIGYVEQVVGPIVHASGIPGAMCDELVIFENGEIGQILSLGTDQVEILTFSKTPVHLGAKLSRTNTYFISRCL
jgi:F0F1-type ATP synthase alpha subunit